MAFLPRTMIESSGSYEFAMEPMTDDLIAELKPLHRAHWEETEAYRHGQALNPVYDVYQALNQAGRFVVFTVRRAGELVGNCMMHVFESVHTRQLEAKEDTIFVAPAHRVPRLAIRFIAYCERCLAAIGVRTVTLSAKVGTRSERLFAMIGYRQVAIEYHKTLGGTDVLA